MWSSPRRRGRREGDDDAAELEVPVLPLLMLLACDPKSSSPSNTDWPPAPGTAWQIQFTGDLDLSVEANVFDLDLFDSSDSTFATIHENNQRLVCYFSAGSTEDWRDDADQYPPSALGDPLDGWEGEWWVDIRDATVREILAARLDYAVERGCDAVDPDNVDGYQNENGLGLTAEDQLDFNLWLAEEAHARDLAIGLKNDLGQLDDLAEHFDFAVNEECHDYDECGLLSAFTADDKSVLNIEYVDDWADSDAKADEVCGQGPALDTLIKTLDLGPEWRPCD